MKSRDFVYWLQGMFELNPTETLDAKQTELIRRHLAMVFLHEIDPDAGDGKQQAALNQAHEGKKPSMQACDNLSGLKFRC